MDDLNIDMDVNQEDIGMPSSPKQERCEKCGKMVNVKANGGLWKHDCGPIVDVKLTADPKADYIDIYIDTVRGMPASEDVSINGKVYQIPRGKKISVPLEVVEVLRNAVATRLHQETNPQTGALEESYEDYSAIPWRKV